MKFKSPKPQYEYLRKKWLAKHKDINQKLFDKHLRHLALGSLGGLMLLTTPTLSLPATVSADIKTIPGHEVSITPAYSKNKELVSNLASLIPKENRNLNKEEETKISEIISKDLKINVFPELEGIRLNRTYGVMGGEQHLYRYPGDTLQGHAKSASDWAMYIPSGIAPGLGAWGYFAPSKAAFSTEDELRERYYLAVQTFLAPGYAENVKEYRDFFKYRKMMVVNPKTGQAVVAVIGDAGPGVSTGKHLGGSPEVMHEIGLGGGPRKGAVLYFFIDDPHDKIPLGPVKVKEEVK